MPPDEGVLHDLEENAGCGVSVAVCTFLIMVGADVLSGGVPRVELATDALFAAVVWVVWTLLGTAIDRIKRRFRR